MKKLNAKLFEKNQNIDLTKVKGGEVEQLIKDQGVGNDFDHGGDLASANNPGSQMTGDDTCTDIGGGSDCGDYYTLLGRDSVATSREFDHKQ